MSKSNKRSGLAVTQKHTKSLGHRPFKEGLNDVQRVIQGPSCIVCQEPIDCQLTGKGYRRYRPMVESVRHGWMHSECEHASSLSLAEKQQLVGSKTVKSLNGQVSTVKFPQVGVKLEVPVYSDEELDAVCAANSGNVS